MIPLPVSPQFHGRWNASQSVVVWKNIEPREVQFNFRKRREIPNNGGGYDVLLIDLFRGFDCIVNGFYKINPRVYNFDNNPMKLITRFQ